MEDQIYILIAKVLHGEASDAELRELDTWLGEGEENRRGYEQMKAGWAEADSLFEIPQFNTQVAWEKVSARMKEPVQVAEPVRGKTIAFPAWAKYSTAVAAVLLIGLFVWRPFGGGNIEVIASAGNQRVELPDHSVITLRSGSSVSYPKEFTASERNVKLDGEAFFEVTRNEQQPFVIDANSVSVRVLGTSFNVVSNAQSADVAVVTGRVQVTAATDRGKQVILTRGEKAHYDNGAFKQSTAEGYEALWRTDSLSFNNEPFSRVISALASVKKTEVKLSDKYTPVQREQAITVSFHNQSLEDMLTELCLITNSKWEKQGANYIVRPK
jgi:transmembrane sensor